MSPILGRMAFFFFFFHCKSGLLSLLCFSKDDEDANSSTKEVTLEDMYSAAKEVDGTGTVDTTSNAAERLKLNQATSTSAGENSNQQVTEQGKKRAVSQFMINDFNLFLLSYIIPFIYHSFPLLFPVSSCRLKVGNFSSHSVPSFSFLALPTPPFSSPLDTYLSSRLVRSLVLFLPCPALPCPARPALSRHALPSHTPPSPAPPYPSVHTSRFTPQPRFLPPSLLMYILHYLTP